jgi:hypothetical protein
MGGKHCERRKEAFERAEQLFAVLLPPKLECTTTLNFIYGVTTFLPKQAPNARES